MRLKNIFSALCTAAVGLLMLTGCEGSDLYSVGSPDWISEKVDSIANSKVSNVIAYVPTPEKLGAVDNTQGWWTVFTEDVQIMPGETYQIRFINYGGGSNWNNWVAILRNKAKDMEYGVMRADAWGWGTGWAGEDLGNHCKATHSWGDDWGTWLAAMNRAKCTALVSNNGDNTADIKVTSIGSDGNSYQMDYVGLAVDQNDMWLAFTVDNSHIEFVSEFNDTDYEPATLTLSGVPSTVNLGTDFAEAFANVTGVVTFAETTVTKEVTFDDLTFETVPDYNLAGEKTLIAVYNKTYMGSFAKKPVIATAQFAVVDDIQSIAVTKAPATYYYYTSAATSALTDRTLAIDFDAMEVTATYANGNTRLVEPSALTFSRTTVPASVGDYELTVTTENGKTATATVTVAASDATTVNLAPQNLGAEDNSAGWWTVFTDEQTVAAGATHKITFTNYAGGSNWNNWVAILRDNAKTLEYGVLRADNWGWGTGWAGEQLAQHCRPSGGQADWGVWLAAMKGAKCEAYITNCNNGTADLQVIMHGTDNVDYIQYYLGLTGVKVDELNYAFTVDGSHIVFD